MCIKNRVQSKFMNFMSGNFQDQLQLLYTNNNSHKARKKWLTVKNNDLLLSSKGIGKKFNPSLL